MVNFWTKLTLNFTPLSAVLFSRALFESRSAIGPFLGPFSVENDGARDGLAYDISVHWL